MKKIAFFDFDGTITKKDTLLEFIKFSKGRLSFYVGFIVNLPFLIAYKLHIISNQRAKEKILSFFFRGMKESSFERLCEAFVQEKLPGLLRPGALQEIRRLQEQQFSIVIVSASPQNWIRWWSNSMNVELIASELETFEGKITGKLCGKNCHGHEKVRRIQAAYSLSSFEEILVYGDTSGDRPMLKLATTGYFRPFR